VKKIRVLLYNRQRDVKFSLPSVRAIIKAILDFKSIACKECSFYFVTERAISDIHCRFFNDPSPTDCITFPLDEEILGEVFICPKTALAFIRNHGGCLSQEIALYIVHGILHLIGYKDKTSPQRKVMRQKEKECIDYLKKLSLKVEIEFQKDFEL